MIKTREPSCMAALAAALAASLFTSAAWADTQAYGRANPNAIEEIGQSFVTRDSSLPATPGRSGGAATARESSGKGGSAAAAAGDDATSALAKARAMIRGLKDGQIRSMLSTGEGNSRVRELLEEELRVRNGEGKEAKARAELRNVPPEQIQRLLASGGGSSRARELLSDELSVRKASEAADAGALASQGAQERESVAVPEALRVEAAGRTFNIYCSDEKSSQVAEKEGLTSMIGLALHRNTNDLDNALDIARTNLQHRGYFLPTLQRVSANSTDVIFDEGRIGKIDIKEGRWFSAGQIRRRYFNDINPGDTFHYFKLREAFFALNSDPDKKADPSIVAGMTNFTYVVGAKTNECNRLYADVSLEVEDFCPVHGMLEVNNYGMKEIEKWQTALTLQYLNLWKADHVLTLSPSVSFGAELWSVAGSYMAPHDWWKGGNTTLYGGYSKLDVDDIHPQLDLEGTGGFIGLQHSEYLKNDEESVWALSMGVMWRHIEDQYTAYSQALNARSASILPLSLALSYTAKSPDCLEGRNFATLQGVYNAMNSGDSLDEMWTGADKNYWILRGQLARLQPIWGVGEDNLHKWLLFLRLEGQYTSDTLIPVEKLSLGGYNSMRGYHARGYLGDYGVYGTLELRTPILCNLGPAAWEWIENLFKHEATTLQSRNINIDRFQALVFLDGGWTAFNDLPSGYDDNEFIYSAGIGLRMSLTKYLQLKCDLAFPLRETDWADDKDMELYFSMQYQF